MKNTAENIFTTIVLVIIAIVMSFVFFYSNISISTLSGWEKIFADFMMIYLLFVLLRTVVLVAFSFGEYFFRKSLKDPKEFPIVSIIMPCYNEEKVVEAAIQSVANLDYPNYEVLVVDDGSTDLTLQTAKKLESKTKVRIISQENGGKSAALNRGISEAVGEYVLCMDADSVLNKNVLKLAMSYFERKPNLAAVAGSVVLGNTDKILTQLQKLEYIIGLNFHKTAQSFLNMVTIVPGPIGVFRRDILLKIGGYHHDTFAEDCDLTIRLLVEGYDLAYCPEMIATTEAPEDVRSLIGQRYRWSRGITQAIVKNSHWLFKPHINFRNFSLLTYMTLESIVIPLMNFALAYVTIEHALIYGADRLMGPFFASLTLLDLVLALYSVIAEKQQFKLLLLAAINRVTYGLALEVLRFYCLLDEFFKIPMNWGKLVRRGL